VNSEELDFSILWLPWLAGLVVLATHVPLGREVLARGIIFIDLAVAQIAALGVIGAHTIGWEPGVWQVQVVAVGSAALGAMLLSLTEKRWPHIQEALIGVSFVLAATAGLILISKNPHGAEELKDLLSGQILWINWESLWPTLVLYSMLLLVWARRRRPVPATFFYLVFALAVTFSVQLVGVYLVFASLIVPALAARHVSGRKGLALAYAVGGLGYGLGLWASAQFDLPSGPAVVWGLAMLALAVGWTIGRATTSHKPESTLTP